MPLITPQGHYLGWKPDKPDHRDQQFRPTRAPEVLPPFVDLTKPVSHRFLPLVW